MRVSSFAMRTESSDEVIARIRDASASACDSGAHRGVIAFDGDGTLWSGDVGDDMLAALLASGRLLSQARDALVEIARTADVPFDDGGDAEAVARAFVHAYEAGTFEEPRFYEVTAWLCAGWKRAAVHAFARDLLVSGALTTRFHREAICVLEWAHTEGHEVFIVSASPRPVVEEAAALLGVAADHVVAVSPLYDADTMLAAVAHPMPYGPGKVTALRERIGARPLYAAFGDNAFDLALLSAAAVPVAVRPKDRLRALAEKLPSLVEMVAPPLSVAP